MIKQLTALLLLLGFQAQSATLLETYQSALKHNPDYQISITEENISKQQVGGTRSKLLPSTNISAGVSNSRESLNATSSSSHNYGITLSQPLFDLSKWYALTQSQLEYRLSILKQQDAQQTLRLNIIKDYLHAAQDKAQLAIEKQQLEQAEAFVQIARERYQAGEVTIVDVETAQTSLSSSKVQYIQAQAQLRISMSNLSATVGQPINSVSELSRNSLAPVGLPELDSWLSLAQDNSSSLLQARTSVKISEAVLTRTQSEYYPTISANAGYTRNGGNGNTETNDLNAGLSLSMPLDLNGSIGYDKARDQFELQKSRQQLQKAQLEITKQIQGSYYLLQGQLQQLRSQQQTVRYSQSLLKHQLSNYQAGRTTATDLDDAHTKLFKNKQDLLKMLYDTWISLSTLQQQAGTLKLPQLTQLSKELN
ncbi:TolC family protein [Dongshaea marina]|uniref:TolC family protein n=1 Tax=Dongshaea marina TaxID=2047966 RepID=UPI000D3E196C|nr:TolC family protein [Dongshaea marina]